MKLMKETKIIKILDHYVKKGSCWLLFFNKIYLWKMWEVLSLVQKVFTADNSDFVEESLLDSSTEESNKDSIEL